MWRDVVSLYCRTADGGEHFEKRVLRGVGLQVAVVARPTLTGQPPRPALSGRATSGESQLYIPAALPGYMAPAAWQAASKAGRAGRFTLQPGDVFLAGGGGPAATKSLAALQQYGRVHTVVRIADYTRPPGPTAHWEVGA